MKTIIFPDYIFHVHFLESLNRYLSFALLKPRGKFIHFDNRQKRATKSFHHFQSRYFQLLLHLRSSKLVKKKRERKKNITRVEFAKIYGTGSFAKVARGDTVERGWRAFDKWIEITNYPRPFRRGFAFDKERGDWFSLKSSVNVRS